MEKRKREKSLSKKKEPDEDRRRNCYIRTDVPFVLGQCTSFWANLRVERFWWRPAVVVVAEGKSC